MNKLPQTIKQEAQELFERARSIPDIIRRLQKIKDPRIRVQTTEELKTYWHRQEVLCHDKTGYYNSNGQWQYTWPSIDSDLATLVQEAQKEQQTQPTPSTIIYQPTPKTPSIMKKESSVSITNNFYGNIGQHISHIDTQHVAFDKDMNMHIEHLEHQQLASTTATSTQATAPDLEKFRQLLTIPYLNRKRECETMIELITQSHWNKKDRARLALALYKSGNVALRREHITTFRQWWRICCELLHWEGAEPCYRISELELNEQTKQILAYM